MQENPSQHSEPAADRHRVIGIWARGLFMGVADVVPGFSGGTVALITGIYERLVNAISHVDGNLFRLLKAREFKRASRHVDAAFLLTLAVGIICGFVVTLLTVHRLLHQESTRPFVLASFLGMVLGSSFLVYQMVREHDRMFGIRHLLLAALAAVIAGSICLLPQAFDATPPLWYVFCAAMIAICAMILPGISGALLLVILGCYEYLTGVARDLVHRENIGQGLTVSVVFGMGALIGLLTFSRVLRHLFNTRPGTTLAFLFGLMLGSIVKLWPFQQSLQEGVDLTEAKLTRPVLPAELGFTELGLFATAVLFALAVGVVARLSEKTVAPANRPRPKD